MNTVLVPLPYIVLQTNTSYVVLVPYKFSTVGCYVTVNLPWRGGLAVAFPLCMNVGPGLNPGQVT